MPCTLLMKQASFKQGLAQEAQCLEKYQGSLGWGCRREQREHTNPCTRILEQALSKLLCKDGSCCKRVR